MPEPLDAGAALQIHLARWQEQTGRRLLIYLAGEGGPSAKGIDESDIVPLYTALRSIGARDRLDLLLYSGGGRVNISRRICLLLRDHAHVLRVIVPYKARSAGTLLCLGADEIVFGPLGELGPIDPQIMAQGDPAGGPQALSPEDLRALLSLSEDWLGLRSPDQRLELLRMVGARIFPLTLGTFYRADRQIRQAAQELLRYQLPALSDEARRAIASQLVSGYGAHDYVITAAEAAALGLQARTAQAAESAMIWDLWQAATACLGPRPAAGASPGEAVCGDALIACAGMALAHITRSVSYLPSGGASAGGRALRVPVEAGWRIEAAGDHEKV